MRPTLFRPLSIAQVRFLTVHYDLPHGIASKRQRVVHPEAEKAKQPDRMEKDSDVILKDYLTSLNPDLATARKTSPNTKRKSKGRIEFSLFTAAVRRSV